MRKSKEATIRVTLKVERTPDGFYIIRKHQSGYAWTTYPFRYGTESEARHDFNVIMKSLQIRGFTPVEEEEVQETEET